MSVFNIAATRDRTKSKLFFDDPVAIARYDVHKYAWLDKLTEKQYGFFWRPQEVDITKDAKDFRALSFHEQHIFTSNLKRQILLDSVQGRAPAIAFGPICSLPELELWIAAWTFSETIHSKSYSYLIQNVYADPSSVFDSILDIKEIVDCAKDISIHYDNLITLNNMKFANKNAYAGNEYEHKKALWLAVMSVNILEGIRFYVSFACSWAFAEVKKMEGNAKIIKLICRDENLHLAATQQLIKTLPQDDKDFVKIAKQTEKECISMFNSAVEQEKAWAKYLFKDGSIIGLNENLLINYIEWIANKRMTAIGMNNSYKGGSNPLPWTQKWIAGSDVQVAPQETAISSYIVGGVKQDINNETFKGMSL
jgi:ribonucleoside-diphosphate reductase beta chain